MSSNTEFDNISFDLPKNQSNVIKVIGVGGGGSNAINHMFSQGIKGVDFVICNTDSQALENSPVPIKIQLGVSLTEGLGAGANPKIGEQSAVESMEEIKNMLTTNTKMIFITAGMGGGTGTGAAPIIAKMAKELDILTVGIVTIPFQFEGKIRNEQAQIGVENLRQNVDSLIVINNNKLREVYGNLGFKAGFSKADEVLATAARGIAEVITHHYTQNIDLRDAKTVLANSGTAIMGSASATGANRAGEAITKALDSPLLNDNKIKGAKNVLLLIVSGGEEITIDEIGEISDHIQDEAGHSANIIMGVGEDDALDGAIAITVIATGFNAEQQDEIVNTETKKIIHTLEDEQKAEQVLTPEPTATPVEIPVSGSEQKNKVEEAPVIRHTLFEEEEEEVIVKRPEAKKIVSDEIPFEGYIETSELIKNIDVTYKEIDIHHLMEFEQVIINEIDVNDFVIVEQKEETIVSSEEKPVEVSLDEQEEQILMFDLPAFAGEEASEAPEKKEPEIEVATTSVEEIEVKDAIEVVPVTEISEEGVKRYSLDDYQEMETMLNEAKPGEDEEVDEEVAFSTKTVESPETDKTDENEPADPLNTPISKLLKDRTEERKKMMKEFNYKFRNSASKIDDIEKQPAYKRAGIDLDETENSDDTNISRTSVNTDDDDIELRSNNSFLHDNVD
ncbi:MAG: cell division protein FtsZ [Bacteroidia bacterium]|nr:cell division protein FtsZ [Bacteroidia bacterium]MBT8276255.1 cell division protein FtsZ [Bacteroidia bacterium]NNF31826.1 cell division protein FtsZ [Flavobacteriaceae bacterium]NNK53335.1 cell division protein FtsZ [Flavobacteriaceae bacterium]NNM07736.1 cell division protein FtsZ [Flavobacteriaceae bacterium]